MEAAKEVPVKPTCSYLLGKKVLMLLGLAVPNYRPNYAFYLYSTLYKLESEGIVSSRLDGKPDKITGVERSLYSLADQKSDAE